MKQIKNYNNEQSYFIAFNAETYFKKNSLEWIINDLIDKYIDEKPFIEKMKNENNGQKCYSPKMLLKVIFYSYCNSIFSSRVMSKNLETNISYIFLSGYTFIDYSTICRFITRYKEEIKEVFVTILYVCYKLKLINLDMIAIDGSKIKANAHKDFTGNKKEFERLRPILQERLKRLLKKQERIDKIEERKYRDIEQKKLNRQIKKYENMINNIDDFISKVNANEYSQDEKINLTDIDSKRQKSKNGFIEGYNVQAASTNDIILSNYVTNNQSDRNELKKAVGILEINLKGIGIEEEKIKETPKLADSGYHDSGSIGELEKNGHDLYIKNREYEGVDRSDKITSKHCEIIVRDKGRCLKCPGGRILESKGAKLDRGNYFYDFYADKKGCNDCIHYEKCRSKIKGSKKFSIKKEVLDNYEVIKRMTDKLESEDGKYIYNQRIGIIEKIFGTIKENWRFNKFYHRGLDKVSTIWSIICSCYNIKAIYNRKLCII
jgi:transposase